MISIVQPNNTYLLPNYVVPCDGVVYRWDFCYFPTFTDTVTLYPSIWRPNDTNTYTLINRNRVTFTTTQPFGFRQCLNHTIAKDERFNVLTGDIVGLYSNTNTQLISYRNNSATSYVYRNSNRSGTVDLMGRSSSDEIIAIKVYIGT